ncbi:MAG: sodium/solute symporter, partial [Bacteroidota bacterium]
MIFVVAVGLYLSLSKKSESAQDYFLASKTLAWWAIGGSLIASNISAEQFIGMSGSGYSVGLAIASYELMAAATLLLVAKYFLPVFLKEGIYTMPQFLEERFDKRVRTGLAFFWVFLIVFVNITSVLYLGGLALRPLMGVDADGNFIMPLFYAILGLALYSATFSIFGGLKAVVWTDVIQVVVLVFGGLLTTIIALDVVSEGQGFFAGLSTLFEKAPEKFDMILDRSNPEYKNLPGISVLIGGMWIANIYYWGTNQYIIQRALAAKSIQEAQKGVALASVLKVLLPIIVVVPGIAAYVLQAEINKPDEAYPWLLNTYVTAGFKGLTFAALISAVGSSLSSMVNSASTIFTLDIYKP